MLPPASRPTTCWRPRHYDAVILDIGLPKLDGYEVLRRMRRKGSKTPVLMLTARDALEDRVKGLDLGADDYLTKPTICRTGGARTLADSAAASPGAAPT